MTAREQLDAIMSAPARIIVLDDKHREVERIYGFVNLAAAHAHELHLPHGWSTVVGLDVES